VKGMSFMLYNGLATWDETGRSSAPRFPGQSRWSGRRRIERTGAVSSAIPLRPLQLGFRQKTVYKLKAGSWV